MRTNRFDAILSALRTGPSSAQTLARLLDAPEASIRRTIQTLRAQGHRIDDARDNNGLYRLTILEETTTTAAA